jgi:hypothetical protein
MSYERSLDMAATRGVRQFERRSALRLTTPFPALVRWRSDGQSCEEIVTLENLSAHGLRMRLLQRLRLGEAAFVLVRFNLDAQLRMPGPGVAIRGVVVRADLLEAGGSTVALLFTRHRMLFASRF